MLSKFFEGVNLGLGLLSLSLLFRLGVDELIVPMNSTIKYNLTENQGKKRTKSSSNFKFRHSTCE